MAQKKLKKVIASKDLEKKRMAEIINILRRTYPEAECSLKFRNSFELLVATMLSAQCTDERVNKVTPPLFDQFPTPQKMAKASVPEIEELIKSTNFFRNKAKAIQAASQSIVEEHDGKVPETIEELVKLRGVGRKTANVVLGVGFGVPGLVVDTHVKRVSARLGFTESTDPKVIEQEIMQIVPKEEWTHYAHLLISHGRAICTARRAYCEDCPLARYCPKIGV